MSRKCNCFRN